MFKMSAVSSALWANLPQKFKFQWRESRNDPHCWNVNFFAEQEKRFPHGQVKHVKHVAYDIELVGALQDISPESPQNILHV